jgi:hypothetical protein
MEMESRVALLVDKRKSGKKKKEGPKIVYQITSLHPVKNETHVHIFDYEADKRHQQIACVFLHEI